MLTVQRKHHILDRLQAEGQVGVADLSRELKVSEDTIRRDLKELSEEGLVLRVHGGALPTSPALGTYAEREGISTESKARLGQAAARLVRPGQIVAIDGGTSNLQLVKALPRELACTVLTHSPLIAAELRQHSRIEVILIGGRLFRHSMVALGPEAVEAIARTRTDLFFLGATGIHPDMGATTGDWEDAAVKRAFCRAAAEVVLLVSPEKWGAAAPFQIVPAADIGTLVVDSATDEAALDGYRGLGITILKA